MQTNRTSIELLETLCAIDSRTMAAPEGATQVSELLGERLALLGFDLDWVDPPPDMGRGRHLKAVRNPDAPERLVLLGHVDTILSPSQVPFRVDLQAGKVYGSGVCDMKGGCVLLLEAVRIALTASAAVRNAGLTILLNSAEECCEPSFRALARESAAGARACLNFEPALLEDDGRHQIVVARKSVVRFHLTCRGRAAHAGNDHPAGINAILEVARKIEALESLTDYEKGLTANVGYVHGGHVYNQVADNATVDFEVRAYDNDVLGAGVAAVHRICSVPTVRSASDGAEARLELRVDEAYPCWSGGRGTPALAAQYITLANINGIQAVAVRRGGGADSNHVADLAPTLDGLGILGGAMHTTGEWADLTSLSARTQSAAEMLCALCAQAG